MCWLLLVGLAAGGAAQAPLMDAVETSPVLAAPLAPPRPRPLSIGYLPDESDFINQPLLVERLREDLLGRPKVMLALETEGFARQIELSPCDGPRDMVQRMNLGEFDMALATAVVYGRQTGEYVPILQAHRHGDLRTGAGWLRRGVVIAGPASPLFTGALPDRARLRVALGEGPLAVPGAESAAGYIYPTLQLYYDYSLTRPGEYWFCGTDAEVVKHVVAGLAPVGACREGALAALLPEAPEGKYYRVLLRTDQFPTDPVLLRATLAPERSALGAELKLALKDFFARAGALAPGLEVDNASPRAYEKIRRDLNLLETMSRRDADAATTAALTDPAPMPTPEAVETPLATPTPLLPPGPAAIPLRRTEKTPTPAPASTPQPTPAARPVLPGLGDRR